MNDELLIIVGAACLAIVFIQSGIPHRLKAWLGWRRIKPLDCEMCLSLWLGIGISIFLEKSVVISICIGGIASVLAIILTKHLNR